MQQQETFWKGKLAEMVDVFERQERGDNSVTFADYWLGELKYEVEAKRVAEAKAQYERDAMVTRLMFEMNRVRAVELLEEMNRVLLERQGRVEPIYTSRHELCLSWATAGGRNQIRVGAEFDQECGKVMLIVTGAVLQKVMPNEDDLKKALVQAFREPNFDIYRW